MEYEEEFPFLYWCTDYFGEHDHQDDDDDIMQPIGDVGDAAWNGPGELITPAIEEGK